MNQPDWMSLHQADLIFRGTQKTYYLQNLLQSSQRTYEATVRKRRSLTGGIGYGRTPHAAIALAFDACVKINDELKQRNRLKRFVKD